jgi:hypothetical protein
LIQSSIAARSCGATRPQRDEHLDLRQDVLVEHGGRCVMSVIPSPRARPRRTRSSIGAEQPLGALHRALRRERVGLVEHQVQRLAVAVVEPLGEVGHERICSALRNRREVEHDG